MIMRDLDRPAARLREMVQAAEVIVRSGGSGSNRALRGHSTDLPELSVSARISVASACWLSGIDREHVEADALGLAGFVQQAVALGLFERAGWRPARSS